MIRSTLSTLTKQTIGRVRRHTSTKQRSITLVVQLPPQMAGKAEEGEQFGQVLLELSHPCGLGALPMLLEAAKSLLSQAISVGSVDGVDPCLHRLAVALPHLLQNVPSCLSGCTEQR